MAYPRTETMQHFLHDFDNMGLSIPRQLKDTGKEWNHCMMKNAITDQALTSGGNGAGVIHPLYVKDSTTTNKQSKRGNPQSKKASQDSKSTHNNMQCNDIQWVENFTKEFREFIDSKYKEHFSPETILGYIYAVLFHKEYREKYLDFLKIDFPKIPFVESKEKFLALSDLGLELLNTHLMREREREREQGIMRMTCNIGLVTCRQTRGSQSFHHSFVAHTIMEMCYISNRGTEGNYLFPLYLCKEA